MTRILIDTNVVLDLALDRSPYAADAQALFEALDQPGLSGLITATTVTDLYYVLRKAKGRETTVALLKDLLQVIDIAGVDRGMVVKALHANWKDFEDAIQAFAAEHQQADYLITRNTKDFQAASVPALSPADFLATWQA
jgi:predicted nucleic acid-binding protein